MEAADAPVPPGFILEGDFLHRREWSFVKRELWWTTGYQTVAGVAGKVTRLQVKNPKASNRIVVVTGARLLAKATTGGRVGIFTDAPEITAAVLQNIAVDTRQPITGAARNVASQNAIDNTLAGGAGDSIDAKTASVVGQDVEFTMQNSALPVVLVPNTFFDMFNLTIAEALAGVIFGYERPATPDELAL